MEQSMLEIRSNNLAARRILVVEDEYYLADELNRALAQHGATVAGPVGTLSDTRAELRSGRPFDAAVLDLRLHDDQSVEIADELKSRSIPFVFTTGYDHALIPDRHRDVPHFEKPCDIGRVLSALAERIPPERHHLRVPLSE